MSVCATCGSSLVPGETSCIDCGKWHSRVPEAKSGPTNPIEKKKNTRQKIIRVQTHSQLPCQAMVTSDKGTRRDVKGTAGVIGSRSLDEDKNSGKRRYKLRVKRKQMKFPELVTAGCVKLAAAVFKKFDLDKDGLISRDELVKSIEKVDAVSPRTAVGRANTVIREIRSNGISKNKSELEDIDFNEFLNAVAASRKVTNAPRTRKLIQNAGLYYNVDKFVAKFYRPREKKGWYAQNYRCWPPPVVTPLLSLFMLAIFIYFVELDNQCAGEKLGSAKLRCPEVFDSIWSYQYDSAYKGEWWRFLTYMALHAGAAHITANICLQTVVGVPLEMVHGPWRVLLLYILGVLAGSFAVSMFDERVNIVGASAGAYALVGAHLANICHYWHVMPYAWPRFALFASIFIVDVVYSAYRKYTGNDSVSYTSHLAGAILGVAMGSFVMDELPVARNTWCQLFRGYFGITVTCLFFTVAIIYNIVSPQPT